MIPLRIEGATHILRAPLGVPNILDLHVRLTDGDVYVSRWEPTPDELAILNAGGSIELQIMDCQPPVSLQAVEHVENGDDS